MATLRSVADLVAAELVDPQPCAPTVGAAGKTLDAVAERYSIAITDAMQNRIDTKNLTSDPVALQFVPDVRELDVNDASLADPIGDDAHSPMKGLVHRYPDRVLLKATELCPVYCRFCFRRESVGGNAARPLSSEELDAIFDYISEHTEIWEVILSGGDPLVLSNARIKSLLDGIARSPHVKIVRLHTRVPVVNPQRIDEALLGLLGDYEKTLYVAVHANHKNEFSDAAKEACGKLSDAGIPLLSQSVLLRGVNDDEGALGDLMRTFVELRITPYYLHQLDKAPGTEHFRVSIERGQALLRALRGTWSGLCQPTYVIDLPGGYGKVSIGPNYVEQLESGSANAGATEPLHITDPNGVAHVYES